MHMITGILGHESPDSQDRFQVQNRLTARCKGNMIQHEIGGLDLPSTSSIYNLRMMVDARY